MRPTTSSFFLTFSPQLSQGPVLSASPSGSASPASRHAGKGGPGHPSHAGAPRSPLDFNSQESAPQSPPQKRLISPEVTHEADRWRERVKMAEYLASIFGTEKDKVNCSFYFKIGACRHGDRCSRLHNKPTFSQTIVLLNLYRNPQNTAQTADGSHCHVSDVEVQEHYDSFFEEVFTELQEKYGQIEEMNVCDNLGDHLVGNVYVKFRREEDAERAVTELNNRWFNGQAVQAELSPVTDFRESCCRQYEMGECTRGGFCNFMHLRPISRDLRRQLYGRGPRRRAPSPTRPGGGHRPRERNRRRSPDHRHGRF
ncbi:splicing factor U2AF 26 kDa subunit [Notamacropus eugenii]|uniref:splicing factor U2AF 26 kDa subunit n=1 Tax=Notamacropus eugenii TaxID=9315 RepID=UPI003B6776FE